MPAGTRRPKTGQVLMPLQHEGDRWRPGQRLSRFVRPQDLCEVTLGCHCSPSRPSPRSSSPSQFLLINEFGRMFHLFDRSVTTRKVPRSTWAPCKASVATVPIWLLGLLPVTQMRDVEPEPSELSQEGGWRQGHEASSQDRMCTKHTGISKVRSHWIWVALAQ